jgi:hypothetical protein
MTADGGVEGKSVTVKIDINEISGEGVTYEGK